MDSVPLCSESPEQNPKPMLGFRSENPLLRRGDLSEQNTDLLLGRNANSVPAVRNGIMG